MALCNFLKKKKRGEKKTPKNPKKQTNKKQTHSAVIIIKNNKNNCYKAVKAILRDVMENVRGNFYFSLFSSYIYVMTLVSTVF